MSRTICVTGSRHWENVPYIEEVLDGVLHLGDTLIHGNCPTGADAIANRYWARLNGDIIPFNADWTMHGYAAGPRRNQQMIDSRPDLVLAFFRPWSASRGTQDTVRRAREADIPTMVFNEAFDRPQPGWTDYLRNMTGWDL